MKNDEFSSEPTLFPVPEAAPSPAPVYTPAPEPEPVSEPKEEILEAVKIQDLPDFASAEREHEEEVQKEPAPVTDDKRRLVKILFFYDDHTFEEYRPQ